MNLDGWAGGGMSLEHYQSKSSILEKHCEECGRDPNEIRRTLLMPCYLTEDQNLIDRAVKGLGPGTVAGSKDYIVDRIGEFKEAGIAEIMFGGIPSGNVNLLQKFDEEILSAFN